MMDIELCVLGTTVVIWYGSDVLSPALGFILEDGPHSLSKCVCVSMCMFWVCMFCNCCAFLYLCVVLLAVCTMNLEAI